MQEYTSFDGWCVYEKGIYGSGASKKQWLINNFTGDIGVFKYPRLHTYKENELTGEHWAEKIASEVAKVIKIPCARVDIGTYYGSIGSMSYIIIDPESEVLFEGIQYITQKYPNYDTDKLYDETMDARYSVQMILECINSIPFKDDFFRIPIFDCLIGNSDRHHSNWGIIVDKFENPIRIAALYDNSSSLCCREREEEIPDILKNKHRFEAIIDSKSKSSIRWMNEKKTRHFDLLKELKSNFYAQTIEVVKNIDIYLTDDIICDIVYGIDKEIMSIQRQELVSKFLISKKNRILNIYSD